MDGWLVDARTFVNVVCSSIGGDGTKLRQAGAGVVRAVRFDDVVLDERVRGPTVDREIAISVWGEGSAIGNRPIDYRLFEPTASR